MRARGCTAPAKTTDAAIVNVASVAAFTYVGSYVVPFLVQFWMFVSPVAYPSSLVPAKWRPLYGLNPMARVIDRRPSLVAHRDR